MATLERRTFLKASGAGFASLALPLPAAHLSWAFGDDEPKPTLVIVYLRGGADPLNIIVPYSDRRYYELRPTIAIPAKDSATHSSGRIMSSGISPSAKKPTSRHSNGCGVSEPPVIRQWNTSEYSGIPVKPRRRPSRMAIGRITSQSMPVSSRTSLTTTSAGE